MNFKNKFRQFPIYFLVLTMLFALISCQNSDAENANLPARYGESGRSLAVEFAHQFPERYAGSDQEKSAAVWLKTQLEDLGYEPEVQEFAFADETGNQLTAENISVKIEGTGFNYVGSKKDAVSEVESINDRFLIIGTHYDTPVKTINVSDTVAATGDGIHNNAAGVATLLTIAKQMQDDRPAYDVRLVFFGANSAEYAGAKEYLKNLNQAEIDSIDAMYNIDRIYAGDKVYAHAGQNSIVAENEKSYEKRKKLYELTDVYYNNMLLTNNNFSLYTNQNVFSVEVENFDTPILFREWTTNLGDHTPFDQIGIPIVFIESFEYNVDSFENLGKESTDPIFSVVNGVINGSNLDSGAFLNEYYKTLEEDKEQVLFSDQEESDLDNDQTSAEGDQETQATLSLADMRDNKHIDRLERRINNIAFLIIKSSQRGDADFEQK